MGHQLLLCDHKWRFLLWRDFRSISFLRFLLTHLSYPVSFARHPRGSSEGHGSVTKTTSNARGVPGARAPSRAYEDGPRFGTIRYATARALPGESAHSDDYQPMKPSFSALWRQSAFDELNFNGRFALKCAHPRIPCSSLRNLCPNMEFI